MIDMASERRINESHCFEDFKDNGRAHTSEVRYGYRGTDIIVLEVCNYCLHNLYARITIWFLIHGLPFPLVHVEQLIQINYYQLAHLNSLSDLCLLTGRAETEIAETPASTHACAWTKLVTRYRLVKMPSLSRVCAARMPASVAAI